MNRRQRKKKSKAQQLTIILGCKGMFRAADYEKMQKRQFCLLRQYGYCRISYLETETAASAKIQTATAARFHHARKERQKMTNFLLVVIALLLVSIWQQLREINERGKANE